VTYSDTDYCSVDELKSQLRITDTVDDTALQIAVSAASRAIDDECHRTFGLTGSAVLRLFDYDGLHIEGRCAVKIADLQTTVGLVVTADFAEDFTFSTTLTLNTDFDLWPWNAAADGVPWTYLVLRPNTTNFASSCQPQARLFSVTGNWGWSAVPVRVKQACLIQAARVFMRRDSWAGIAGSPDLGNELRLLSELDPDVRLLLSPLVRVWGAA
jgi:hypothetical protein